MIDVLTSMAGMNDYVIAMFWDCCVCDYEWNKGQMY